MVGTMIKKSLIILFLLAFATNVYAQSADLVTAIVGEDVTDQKTEKKQHLKEEHVKQKNKENVVDDRSAFGFLNFSFIKKPLSMLSFSKEEPKESPKSDVETNHDEETKQNALQPVVKKETPLERAVRLAEEGDEDTALSLGYMYLYGTDGVESDYAKAFHFYEIAALKGNAVALNNLGSLYFNGIGVDVDYQKALELFLKAAQNGNDDAALNLGFIYLSTKKHKYFKPALTLFEQAGKAGNNTAKFMLGYAYYKGFEVEQDYYKAFDLIKAAADAKFDEAQYVLAEIYAGGYGVPQNYSEAVKQYRLAIVQGNIESMMRLASLLEEGKKYPRNLLQAHILYNVAAVYSVKQAAEKRDEVEARLKIEELLEAQTTASQYTEKPSELTQYIRQTFGTNIRQYIDENIKKEDEIEKKPQQ